MSLFRNLMITLSGVRPAQHAVVQLLRGRISTAPEEPFQTLVSFREGDMTSKQVMIVAVLAAVLTWSAVMTALGQLAAVAALLPSLGLLIQQIVSVFIGAEVRSGAAQGSRRRRLRQRPAEASPAGSEEPAR